MFDQGGFFEVFVDTTLEVCETRDAKGLYARARRGVIPSFTGVTAPYEAPVAPELRLDGAHAMPEPEIESALGLLGFGLEAT